MHLIKLYILQQIQLLVKVIQIACSSNERNYARLKKDPDYIKYIGSSAARVNKCLQSFLFERYLENKIKSVQSGSCSVTHFAC